MAYALPLIEAMATTKITKTPRRSSVSEPTCILRWVFYRGGDALTCAVEAGRDRSPYNVYILPHGDLSVATVEHFTAPASALRRHAEIALQLRQAGWVVEYGSSQSTAIAA
jgi:hypothetical protein